jgi:hypothetical protein
VSRSAGAGSRRRNHWTSDRVSSRSESLIGAAIFGKIMAMNQPKHAVAYPFQNDPDTLPEVVSALR